MPISPPESIAACRSCKSDSFSCRWSNLLCFAFCSNLLKKLPAARLTASKDSANLFKPISALRTPSKNPSAIVLANFAIPPSALLVFKKKSVSNLATCSIAGARAALNWSFSPLAIENRSESASFAFSAPAAASPDITMPKALALPNSFCKPSSPRANVLTRAAPSLSNSLKAILSLSASL